MQVYIDSKTFQYISIIEIKSKILKYRFFPSLYGPLFCKNQGRSIYFDTCNFRLAKQNCKTVQIKVREYTDIALPNSDRRKLINPVSDHQDRSYSCFKKASQHVDQSTSGTNGLVLSLQKVRKTKLSLPQQKN